MLELVFHTKSHIAPTVPMNIHKLDMGRYYIRSSTSPTIHSSSKIQSASTAFGWFQRHNYHVSVPSDSFQGACPVLLHSSAIGQKKAEELPDAMQPGPSSMFPEGCVHFVSGHTFQAPTTLNGSGLK